MVSNTRTQAQLTALDYLGSGTQLQVSSNPGGRANIVPPCWGGNWRAAFDHSVSNTSFMLFSIPPPPPLQEEYQEYEPEA